MKISPRSPGSVDAGLCVSEGYLSWKKILQLKWQHNSVFKGVVYVHSVCPEQWTNFDFSLFFKVVKWFC